MKKLLLTVAALTLCIATSVEARLFGDCNSCNTGCKKEKTCKNKKECKPCKKECKPAAAECFTCEKPCIRTEQQKVKIIVPCQEYHPVMRYEEHEVLQTRQVCEPVAPKVGKWTCCDEDRKAGRHCGQCEACHSEGVEIDPATGILTNHPLYREAKNDSKLAEKLREVDAWNKEHNVQAEGNVAGSFNDQDMAANEKTLTKKEKAAQKRAAKKANRANKNTEMIEAEEMDIEAA